VKVTFNVTNTGKRPTTAVPQLYVHDVASSLPRPPRELKGFRSLELQPGQTKTVSMELNDSAFAYYNPDLRKWMVEPGRFEIQIGISSRNIVLKQTMMQQD
jgi:beta-glucosidase